MLFSVAPHQEDPPMINFTLKLIQLIKLQVEDDQSDEKISQKLFFLEGGGLLLNSPAW